MADHSRIEVLTRRIQQDPASIAFAQLAEEYRRAGQCEQAVEVCRVGLATHPGYLSARVTLGRALFELGRLDEAREELEFVLTHAPDNLAARRGLADIRYRQGALSEARSLYEEALRLAPNDPELERVVADLAGAEPEPAQQAAFGAPTGGDAFAVAEPASSGAGAGARPASPDRTRALQTIAALEQWLAAIHVTRAQRHA